MKIKMLKHVMAFAGSCSFDEDERNIAMQVFDIFSSNG